MLAVDSVVPAQANKCLVGPVNLHYANVQKPFRVYKSIQWLPEKIVVRKLPLMSEYLSGNYSCDVNICF